MYILDSGFICSYFLIDQSTHQKVIEIINKVKFHNIFILNITLQEVAKMASRKMTQQIAISIYENTLSLQPHLIRPTIEDEDNIWKLFKSYQKKNISFVDCANLYFAPKKGFKIATFDTFYPSECIEVA